MDHIGYPFLCGEYQSFRLPNGQVDGVPWLTCGSGALPRLAIFDVVPWFRNGRFLSGLWKKDAYLCTRAVLLRFYCFRDNKQSAHCVFSETNCKCRVRLSMGDETFSKGRKVLTSSLPVSPTFFRQPSLKSEFDPRRFYDRRCIESKL